MEAPAELAAVHVRLVTPLLNVRGVLKLPEPPLVAPEKDKVTKAVFPHVAEA